MSDHQRDDAGFGMVEIIVSMLMLAILAVILAPVIIGGVQSTAKMSSIATATQMVNDGLETHRDALRGGGCPATSPAPTEGATTDSRGVQLVLEVTYSNLADCGSTGLVDVTVRVATSGQSALFPESRELATAMTKVYVS